MPNWQNSDRRDRLPPNWDAIRKRVLKRDGYRCRATNVYGERCDERAVDVDHIKRDDDHSEDALQSLCEWHHDKKSGAEGARARAAIRRRHAQKFRRTEGHPGLL
ncbi:HNH endonuclease [Micromonospora sp. CB01531]|uniref:HNH endonuclease n=1 Tax=Micromonospora sp. CB01531 TaxID=1718947 RepID=UPI00093FED35|nr:HNH endonuclease [Micromonospora sp. CB01531]OKI45100.1 HNH endonuclease [Micromonospora sp. CB01531]